MIVDSIASKGSIIHKKSYISFYNNEFFGQQYSLHGKREKKVCYRGVT
jgi:hypothetical protein